MIAVHPQTHMKHVIVLCEHNEKFFCIKVGSTVITVILLVKLLTYQGKCKFLHPYVLYLECEVHLSLKSYISLNC
jgi:hypothetical protein